MGICQKINLLSCRNLYRGRPLDNVILRLIFCTFRAISSIANKQTDLYHLFDRSFRDYFVGYL